MTRSRLRTTLAGAALLVATPAVAQEDAPGSIDFEEYRLDNGLRVVLSEDHSTPVVAVNLWYDVGSRNERPGRSGFAHLFEHMMFQGSENVAKAEHMTLVESVGGSMNGTTSEDRTAYFETVPSDRLNLALWLEADRMRSLALTEENLENQRETVKEERRLRIDNQPYGKAFLASSTAPYDSAGCFPYAHSVIGSMEDLDAASLQDVRDFFRTYYAPNNATLVVVGDFDPAVARDLIERYFGPVPAQEPPPEPTCEVEFAPGFVSDTIHDPNANVPGVFVAYRVPAHGEEDTYALSLLATILGGGESSRLHQALVKDARAALQAGAGLDNRLGPGLLNGFLIANQGVPADSLFRLFLTEVERLRTEAPPTPEELEKAKNRVTSQQIMGRQSVFGKASTLQHHALFHDDLSEVNTEVQRYMDVTLEDLRRVADRYLVRENLTAVFDIPGQAAEAATDGADR